MESSPKRGLAGSVLNNPILSPLQDDVGSMKRRLQPLHSVSHTVTPGFPFPVVCNASFSKVRLFL